VIRRDGEMLVGQTGPRHYHMRVDRWREWCEKSGAEAATVVNQEGLNDRTFE
jgi:hypothetical protein